jgi:hypothetical protein
VIVLILFLLRLNTCNFFEGIPCQFPQEPGKDSFLRALERHSLSHIAGPYKTLSKDISPPEFEGTVTGAVSFSENILKPRTMISISLQYLVNIQSMNISSSNNRRGIYYQRIAIILPETIVLFKFCRISQDSVSFIFIIFISSVRLPPRSCRVTHKKHEL